MSSTTTVSVTGPDGRTLARTVVRETLIDGLEEWATGRILDDQVTIDGKRVSLEQARALLATWQEAAREGRWPGWQEAAGDGG